MDDTFLLKMEDQAKREISGRGQHDPIINKYLTYHEMGELTYEQALEGMVIHLSNSKNEYHNKLVKMVQLHGDKGLY